MDRAERYVRTLARRYLPSELQVQFLLGSILGAGSLRPGPGGLAFGLELAAFHGWLADWTYAWLAPIVDAPAALGERIVIRSSPHPLFADVASLVTRPRRLRRRLTPAALWVWATHERVQTCERSRAAPCGCATPWPAAGGPL